MVVVAAMVGLELFSRFYLGLGDPPLWAEDPEIEYLLKASQSCRRLDNYLYINQWSMRSDDFPKRKEDSRELRIMVFGDSIINGAIQTDQGELATTLLQNRLGRRLGRKVVVGNISAGSWGPPNLLAYARRFGLMDSDVVIIVLSSHDYADVPSFQRRVGVQPNYPAKKPLLASAELVERYIVPRLSPGGAPETWPGAPPQRAIQQALSALKELLRMSREAGAAVIVAQHLEREEIGGHEKPGHAVIEQVAREAGARIVQLGPAFAESVRAGNDPYRDPIHPNATGQKIMADVLEHEIDEALGAASTRPVR